MGGEGEGVRGKVGEGEGGRGEEREEGRGRGTLEHFLKTVFK